MVSPDLSPDFLGLADLRGDKTGLDEMLMEKTDDTAVSGGIRLTDGQESACGTRSSPGKRCGAPGGYACGGPPFLQHRLTGLRGLLQHQHHVALQGREASFDDAPNDVNIDAEVFVD